MARHEKTFDAAAEATLDGAELALLAKHGGAANGESRAAILARFLSGSDCSADTARDLGGSFAGKTDGAPVNSD